MNTINNSAEHVEKNMEHYPVYFGCNPWRDSRFGGVYLHFTNREN